MRIAEMILYFFYKNMLFTVPQFIYAFYCGFSGQTLFDDYYISLYNLFFTSLPLVIRAILEQDVYYIRPSMKISPVEEPNGKDILMRSMRTQIKDSRYIPKDYEINKYLYRLFPKIYFVGQKNTVFNYTNFIYWIAEGIVEAIMITFFCLYIFSTTSLNSSGHSNDLWITSITMYF
jgi:magnesium-transporting ATPase (P-type)